MDIWIGGVECCRVPKQIHAWSLDLVQEAQEVQWEKESF